MTKYSQCVRPGAQITNEYSIVEDFDLFFSLSLIPIEVISHVAIGNHILIHGVVNAELVMKMRRRKLSDWLRYRLVLMKRATKAAVSWSKAEVYFPTASATEVFAVLWHVHVQALQIYKKIKTSYIINSLRTTIS